MGKLIKRLGVIGLVSGVAGVPEFFNYKISARLAGQADVTIGSAPATFDSVAPTIGDRILLPNQTDPIQNGLYIWNGASVAMVRTQDFNESSDVLGGAEVRILQGSVSAQKNYIMSTDFPDIGTDPISFILETGDPTITPIAKNSSFTLSRNIHSVFIKSYFVISCSENS